MINTQTKAWSSDPSVIAAFPEVQLPPFKIDLATLAPDWFQISKFPPNPIELKLRMPTGSHVNKHSICQLFADLKEAGRKTISRLYLEIFITFANDLGVLSATVESISGFEFDYLCLVGTHSDKQAPNLVEQLVSRNKIGTLDMKCEFQSNELKAILEMLDSSTKLKLSISDCLGEEDPLLPLHHCRANV